MKRCKLIALLMASTLTLGLLTGCGSEADKENDEPITVTMWNNWTGPDGEYLKTLVKEYNETNGKNITIEMDIMEYSSLQEKLVTAIASNSCPNMYIGSAISEYALDGAYVAIDDIWEKTDLKKEDFDPDILSSCYLDGHLMGIPFQISSYFLYWNKDLFEQAGLDPEKGVSTWEELVDASIKIDQLGGNIVGGGFPPNDMNGQMIVGSMIHSYGGEILVDEGDGNFKCVLTDPEYIEGNRKALELLQRYAKESKILTAGNLEEGFGSGIVGMLVSGAWETANAKDNNINFGISLLPKGPEDGPYQPSTRNSFCIMKGTEGRTYEAALDFIAWWNDSNNKNRDHCPAFDWTKELSYQPYLISVAEDEELTSDPVFKITSEFRKYGRSNCPPTFWNEFALGFNIIPLCENVTYEMLSIDDALKNTENTINELLAEMVEKEQDLGLR